MKRNTKTVIAGSILYIAGTITGLLEFNGWISLIIWSLGLFSLFTGIFNLNPSLKKIKLRKLFDSKTELFLFSLVLLTGIFFRFYQLNSIPSTLWSDEMEFSLKAINIIEGGYKAGLFSLTPMHIENWVCFSNLYLYFVIVIFKLMGINFWAIKMVSVLPSLGVIVFSYFFFKAVSEDKFTPLIATLLISVSHWSVTISRWGWNEILMNMFQVFSAFCFIKGLSEKDYKYFALAGISLGLSLYTYIGAIVFIVISLIFFVSIYFAEKDNSRNILKGFITFLISLIIVTLPFIISYKDNPDSYLIRFKELSISNRIIPDRSLKPLVKTTLDHLKMFHFQGDSNNRHNTDSTPQLDIFSGIFFVIGFILCIVNLRKPYNILLFIWLIVCLISSIVSSHNESPQAYRTAMAIPVIMFFVASGLYFSYNHILKKSNRKYAIIFAVGIIVSILCTNFSIYFIQRPASKGCYYSIDKANQIELVREVKKLLKTSPKTPVFIYKSLITEPKLFLILNYVPPGKKDLPLDLQRQPFFILKDALGNLFHFTNSTCYLFYPEKLNTLVKKLYKNSKIKKLQDPFGGFICYVAYIDKKSISDSRGFKIISSYPDSKESILQGSIIISNESKLIFKRNNINVRIMINGKNIFNNSSMQETTELQPDSIASIAISGPSAPDHIINSISVKNNSHVPFTPLTDRFNIYKLYDPPDS